MSWYDKPESYSTVQRALRKLKLEYKHASKHDVATCPNTGNKTTVPRHKGGALNKYTVGSIIEFLMNCGYSKEEIKKAFKWH